MRYNTVGDLFRIHSIALASGADFRWVTIPNDAVFTRSEFFDPVQMGALYDTGFRLASSATAWQRTPPGFVLDD